MEKLDLTKFINKANVVHSFKYTYNNAEYTGIKNKLLIFCHKHGDFIQSPDKHLRGQGCPKCKFDKMEQTNIKKYGTKYPSQNKEIQEKIKQTNIERYGADNPFSNKEIQYKIKKTMLEKYGVASPIQNKEIQDKIKKTMLEKYGAIHTYQSCMLNNKIKQTNLDRYGVEFPTQNNDIYNKIKKTNLERYGVASPIQNNDIYNKIKQTNLEKYGVASHTQKHMLDILPLINDYTWLFQQYILYNKTSIQIAQELNIDITTICNYLRKHEIEIKYTVGYSIKCIQWLESIMEQEDIFIQHAGNIGEYQIPGTRYKADGYCHENNTVYEFHGDIFHGNPDLFKDDDKPNFYKNNLTAKELYNKTKEREQEIINLGYNIITIWENDYNGKT